MMTRREYEQAVKARKLYTIVGHPSMSDFTNMIQMNPTSGVTSHSPRKNKCRVHLWKGHWSFKRENYKKET
eukprot:11599642-Ditylum_brightwellii.AAC.1